MKICDCYYCGKEARKGFCFLKDGKVLSLCDECYERAREILKSSGLIRGEVEE